MTSAGNVAADARRQVVLGVACCQGAEPGRVAVGQAHQADGWDGQVVAAVRVEEMRRQDFVAAVVQVQQPLAPRQGPVQALARIEPVMVPGGADQSLRKTAINCTGTGLLRHLLSSSLGFLGSTKAPSSGGEDPDGGVFVPRQVVASVRSAPLGSGQAASRRSSGTLARCASATSANRGAIRLR